MSNSALMFAPRGQARLRAVVANHNTSMYVEILVRTLLAAHQTGLADVSLTIVDNQSADAGVEDLVRLAHEVGAEFVPSGFGLTESPNTHGDNLSKFVLESDPCEAFLFLDSDVVVLESDTLPRMRAELASSLGLWAVQASYVAAERRRGRGGSRERGGGEHTLYWSPTYSHDVDRDGAGRSLRVFKTTNQARCHPGFTLVRDSAAFRAVTRGFGLGAGYVLSHDPARGGWYDTFGLVTRAMETHGLDFAVSDASVHHIFGVSYDLATRAQKDSRYAALRDELRAGGGLAAAASAVEAALG